jgi:hypothetical protein
MSINNEFKGRIQVPDDFDAPLPTEALTGSS